MGKIIIPGQGAEGEARFFQETVKYFLSQSENRKYNDFKPFSDCYTRDNVSLYLTAIQSPKPGEQTGSYELVAFNEEGKTRSFRVTCDPNFQVKGIDKIKTEDLTAESKEVVEEIKTNRMSPADEEPPSRLIPPVH